MICGPTTVAWFIALVWIDSIYALAGRALAHVRKEFSKVIAPRLTHSNSTAAVNRIFGICRRIASASGVKPSPIGSGFVIASRMPMSSGARCRNLISKATTTRRSFAADGIQINFRHLPAVTTKCPYGPTAVVRDTVECNESAVTLASDVQWAHNVFCSTILVTKQWRNFNG